MMLWSSTWSTCKCWFISEGVVEIVDMSLLDLEYIMIFAALLGATGIACSMAGFGGLFPYYLHGFWVSCGFVHIFLGFSSYFIYIFSFLGFLLGMSYLLFLSSIISFSNKSLFNKKN